MSRRPLQFDNHPMGFPTAPEYRAFGGYVVDGDTIDVFVDLGLFQYAYETVRITGYDAPEIFRPKDEAEREAGYAAKEFLATLVLDQPLKIATEKDRESFGRFVAHVWCWRDGAWLEITDAMKAAGFDTT